MDELEELYQEVMIEHARQPKNFGPLEHPTCSNCGHNPLCGDKVEVYVRIENGRVKDISFTGSGCAISMASASVMTEAVKGRTVEEAARRFALFHNLVTGASSDALDVEELEDMAAFSGLKNYPIRVKCATLAWHALRSIIEAQQPSD